MELLEKLETNNKHGLGKHHWDATINMVNKTISNDKRKEKRQFI